MKTARLLTCCSGCLLAVVSDGMSGEVVVAELWLLALARAGAELRTAHCKEIVPQLSLNWVALGRATAIAAGPRSRDLPAERGRGRRDGSGIEPASHRGRGSWGIAQGLAQGQVENRWVRARAHLGLLAQALAHLGPFRPRPGPFGPISPIPGFIG